MEEKTAGQPSGFAPPAPSCLWASATTSVPGCPRRGEVRTARKEPLGVPKSTGWQFLRRTGQGLPGLVSLSGGSGGRVVDGATLQCQVGGAGGRPAWRLGEPPGPGGRASRRASLPPRARWPGRPVSLLSPGGWGVRGGQGLCWTP